MSVVGLARANLIGGIWMIAAMAAFTVEDSFIKAAADSLPIAQILVMFGLGGAGVFALVARATGQALYTRDVLSPPMRVRVVFEVLGRLFYVLALALTPLATATVILQATPLVVVAGAALIFGERVGWRRWAAICIGLAGVLVTVRPWGDGVSALSLLAVVGMLGFAGRDLASRAAPAALTTAQLGLYGFLSVAAAGALFALWEQGGIVWPGLRPALCLAGATLAGVAAYGCLMRAMRTGEVASVTPLRYTRLLFGTGAGVLIFGETLTAPMIWGASLIVVSGLFVFWRGGRAD